MSIIYQTSNENKKVKLETEMCKWKKLSFNALLMRKCCIEYPIKTLRLARSGVIKFLTRI